ncbi:MAG: PfaD family polyunsaturated fatty acid/polyketide biosynthesis protein [Akkermansiaceae bacterium]
MNYNPSSLDIEAKDTLEPFPVDALGSRKFLAKFEVESTLMVGSMANGIASVELVKAMLERRWLASFGAAGLSLEEIRKAIRQLQQVSSLNTDSPKNFAVNLIHSPQNSDLEWKTVELLIEEKVPTVEASAFLQLTPAVVWSRAKGLRLESGKIVKPRQLIAKVSRREVAEPFISPAPQAMLDALVARQAITAQEAELASRIPMCDALTVEADSGGHTDGQPALTLLPAMLSMRSEFVRAGTLTEPLFIGAAGGMSTPAAIAAAYTMGADYVVTGSINQSCVEAGTSETVKQILAKAKTSDVAMAPAADMFEMGVQVQVLKQGTMFPMRAQKLYELYRTYSSLDQIPAEETKRLEEQFFRMPLREIVHEVSDYVQRRHPESAQIELNNPKKLMLRVFLWYMAHSSTWATQGTRDRQLDYQIWCGPAMGAFNAWVKNSTLANPDGRHVFKVSYALMHGAATLMRVQQLRMLNTAIPDTLLHDSPDEAVLSLITTAKLHQEVSTPSPQLVEKAQTSQQQHPVNRPPRRVSKRQIAKAITEVIAEQLDMAPSSIDINMSFQSFHLDSVKALLVLKRLEKLVGSQLSPTLIWNYPNIHDLATYLSQLDVTEQTHT